MNKLPVLLSIPHGGTQKPPELDSHLAITDKDLFDDSDPFVIEIYDLGEKVEGVVKTNIARAFVDLNRSLEDLPPQNPDGLIKSSTCYEKPIYKKGREPDDSLTNVLIEMYYKPYHNSIQKRMRPMFCLSNQDGKTSSTEMIELLASCISDSFDIDRNEISLNDPFHGGYITRTYGNNPLPWIQIEMNRDMYLGESWFDGDSLSIDSSRLRKLNEQFKNCLKLFFQK
ncbi:MAG: N-formylglutamate amidohydrolase [Nitrosopumilaceae archaeon]